MPGSTWSTAILLVGTCIEHSQELRSAVGASCRAALAAPAPPGVVSRSMAALHALAKPGEEIPGLESTYLWWILGPFPDREALFGETRPFRTVDLHARVL